MNKIDQLLEFCWAANDKYGNTYIGSVNFKTKETNYKVI